MKKGKTASTQKEQIRPVPRFAPEERFVEHTFLRAARQLGYTPGEAAALFAEAVEGNQIWNVNTSGLLGNTPVFQVQAGGLFSKGVRL